MDIFVRRFNIFMRSCLSIALRSIEIITVGLAVIGIGILIIVDFIFGD